MSLRRPSNAANIARLHGYLDRLEELRNIVSEQRVAIQFESELLSNHFTEGLEGELQDVIWSLPEEFEGQYRSLREWAETFAQRSQAIKQLEDHIKQPEKELREADADFVVAAENLVKQPFVPSESVSQPYPLLLEMHNAKRSSCQILLERLAELEWEHEDALLWRDLQRDQDTPLDATDEDFERRYISARAPLETELRQMQQEAAALEAGCRAQGFDMTGQRYGFGAELSPPASHQQFGEEATAVAPPIARLAHESEVLRMPVTYPLDLDLPSEGSVPSVSSSVNHGHVTGWLRDVQRADLPVSRHRHAASEPTMSADSNVLAWGPSAQRPNSR